MTRTAERSPASAASGGDDEYITMQEAAQMARMSYQNFTREVQPYGEIPFIRVPAYKRKKLVRRGDVRAWMQSAS